MARIGPALPQMAGQSKILICLWAYYLTNWISVQLLLFLSEQMANIYDVKSSDLIRLAADRLKGKLDKPTYIDYVKTGSNKERIPQDPDFWYVRSASILRQVYLNGPIGVSRLRTRYGSRKGHVVHRMHHRRAGGSIIRDSLMGLEKLNYVKNTKGGRVITPQGRSFVDKICKELNNA